jgi:cytochrome b6-f complex iron-sulfur subunit
MSETRRDFIKRIGMALAGAIPAVLVPVGCGSPGLPVYRYDNSGGSIDLYLKWYPELLKTGGVIELLIGGKVESVYVARVSFSRFAAISPVCGPEECKVALEKNLFRCPCDGSTYDLDGKVVSGPAEKPLRAFRTQNLDTSVRIFIE